VKDPKTWLLFLYTVLTSLPNGGYTNVSFSDGKLVGCSALTWHSSRP
jgi:hypothetical protein